MSARISKARPPAASTRLQPINTREDSNDLRYSSTYQTNHPADRRGAAGPSELRLEVSFDNRNMFFRFNWDLERTITADVDTRKRTVTNIELQEAELQQDGIMVGGYTK